MGLKSLKTKVENLILNTPLLPKKYSHLLLLLSLAFFTTECAQKKAGALGGSSSGGTSSGAASTDSVVDTAISYTQSTITVSAGTINHGETATVYATFKNSAGASLDLPSESMSFSLTGAGTIAGTFSSPQYDAANKRWYSTFTSTVAAANPESKNILVTHELNGSPQALTSTLPSITVNPLTAPTATLSMNSIRSSATAPFDVFITFSRDVSGFAGVLNLVTASSSGGLSITDPASVGGSNTLYSVTITPNDSSSVSVALDANKVQDALGYYNTAATTLIASYIDVLFSNLTDNYYYSNLMSSPSIEIACSTAGGLVQLSVNGIAHPTGVSCATSPAIFTGMSFVDGLNTLIAYQLDNDNNNFSKTISVYSDTSAPTISLNSSTNNISDSTKSAVTVTGECNDDQAANNASISIVLSDNANNNYNTSGTTCVQNANGPDFAVVADLSAATVAGSITASATITDLAGNSTTDTRSIGNYLPSGNIQNLQEQHNYSSIGQYSTSGANTFWFSGTCSNLGYNSPNNKIHVTLLDGSDNLVRTVGDIDCSSGSFSSVFYSYNEPINLVPDGSYKFKFEACSDYYECSFQTHSFVKNDSNDCWSSGGGTFTSWSNGEPQNLGSGSCTRGTPTVTTTCDDGSSSSSTVGTSSESCNCQNYTNNYYTNFNDNNLPTSSCGATDYSESFTSSSSCSGAYDPYDGSWNNSLGCSCSYMSQGSYSNPVQVSCGQQITVQGGSTYTCGDNSSTLNGCWRCTDNTSQNPTDCANNTSVSPSGRTWTAASCSHTDG
ncbi:MAG: hypothetical protein KA116_12985, partial [Proteobacteria bacterium]|nr:hypothetical protein [Pseudomonadota bacterium]